MPAAARPAADSLFANPVAAGFLAVELRAHHARVDNDSRVDGAQPDPLVAPRLNLLAQAAHELEQITTPAGER